MKSAGGDDAAHPEFDQRWMLWIHAEIVVAYVGDPRRYVIGLIDHEAVEAGSDSGTQDGRSHQQQCKP